MSPLTLHSPPTFLSPLTLQSPLTFLSPLTLALTSHLTLLTLPANFCLVLLLIFKKLIHKFPGSQDKIPSIYESLDSILTVLYTGS